MKAIVLCQLVLCKLCRVGCRAGRAIHRQPEPSPQSNLMPTYIPTHRQRLSPLLNALWAKYENVITLNVNDFGTRTFESLTIVNYCDSINYR